MAGQRGQVIAVVGARGGVGASTLAAAMARVLARHGSTVLVDLDPAGCGIDVLVGVEALPGVRWPDLAAARGEVVADDVAVLLPRWAGCAVLSGDRMRPGLPQDDVVTAIVTSLAGGFDAVVLDVGRSLLRESRWLADTCTGAVIVASTDMVGVAGALMVREALRDAAVPCVVVTRPAVAARVAPSEVAAALGVPWLAHLRDDRSVARSVEHGVGPLRQTGRTARAVRRILAGAG